MIIKEGKVGNSDSIIVTFGKGSISMIPSIKDDGKTPVLLLRNDSSGRKVGDIQKSNYKDSNEFMPELSIIFENEQGMDAFIASIEDCREYFNNEEKQ